MIFLRIFAVLLATLTCMVGCGGCGCHYYHPRPHHWHDEQPPVVGCPACSTVQDCFGCQDGDCKATCKSGRVTVIQCTDTACKIVCQCDCPCGHKDCNCECKATCKDGKCTITCDCK